MPSGLHYFVDISGFTMFLLIVGNLNNQALAATNIAFSINGLIFVPLLGFGTAIQTVVGHHIGAGHVDAARVTTRNAAIMGVLWTGTMAVILVLFPEWLLRPFFLLANPETIGGADIAALTDTAAWLLNFVAAYSMFDALAVVYSSALRGAGDTVFPMVITLLFKLADYGRCRQPSSFESDHASILGIVAHLHGAYIVQRDLHADAISVWSMAEDSSDRRSGRLKQHCSESWPPFQKPQQPPHERTCSWTSKIV